MDIGVSEDGNLDFWSLNSEFRVFVCGREVSNQGEV